MSLDNKPVYSGGCQCGAVRFHVEGALGDASICHCRMCQKASGNFYLPLVSVRGAKLSWTRGEPKKFRSSNHAWRGFCVDCGTPLFYEAPDGIAMTIAAGVILFHLLGDSVSRMAAHMPGGLRITVGSAPNAMSRR